MPLHKDSESGIFKATVDVGASDKIFYKYIVDGNWTLNDQAPREVDSSGIENNVLYEKDMTTPTSSSDFSRAPRQIDEAPAPTVISDAPSNAAPSAAALALLQSAAPQSSTAVLAADVPREAERVTALPIAPDAEPLGANESIFTSSAAPVSSTAALAGQQPIRKDIAPSYDDNTDILTPSLDDVPGGFPETPAPQADNREQEMFSVNPLPAASSYGNPVNLEAGQPVPAYTTADVNDTVRLDKESYERADASNLGAGYYLPPVVTPDEVRLMKGTGVLDIPPIAQIIPESSLPISEPTSQFAPATTTSTEVVAASDRAPTPKPKPVPEIEAGVVPEVVKHSQEEANVSPEASAVPEIVEAKKEVEKELEARIPETAPAAQGGGYVEAASNVAATAGTTVLNALAATGAVLSQQASAAVETAKDLGAQAQQQAAVAAQKASELSGQATSAVPHAETPSKDNIYLPPAQAHDSEIPAASVPEVVKESQALAHASPEASADEQLVRQKHDLETELITHPPHLEHAETHEATAVIGKDGEVHQPVVLAGLEKGPSEPEPAYAAENVPEVVRESQAAAHVGPEASGVAHQVELKDRLEDELKHEVPEVKPVQVDTTPSHPADNVPEVVRESQAAAHVGPEAAGVASQVALKDRVEDELKSEVKPVEEVVTKLGEQTGPASPPAGGDLNVAPLPLAPFAIGGGAASSTATQQPTVRAVAPEQHQHQQQENHSPSSNVSPLTTPSLATATVSTFTTPVVGQTFNNNGTTTADTNTATTTTTAGSNAYGSNPSNNTTTKAYSAHSSENGAAGGSGTHSPTQHHSKLHHHGSVGGSGSGANTPPTEQPKEKRRSLIMSKVRNFFGGK